MAIKNIKQISEWQKLNPEYNNPDSKQNDRYQKIIFNSMSGSTKEESDKNYEKICNEVKKILLNKLLFKKNNNYFLLLFTLRFLYVFFGFLLVLLFKVFLLLPPLKLLLFKIIFISLNFV